MECRTRSSRMGDWVQSPAPVPIRWSPTPPPAWTPSAAGRDADRDPRVLQGHHKPRAMFGPSRSGPPASAQSHDHERVGPTRSSMPTTTGERSDAGLGLRHSQRGQPQRGTRCAERRVPGDDPRNEAPPRGERGTGWPGSTSWVPPLSDSTRGPSFFASVWSMEKPVAARDGPD